MENGTNEILDMGAFKRELCVKLDQLPEGVQEDIVRQLIQKELL